MANPGHIEVGEAASRLGVTARHLRRLCSEGRVPGAVKKGRGWLIPTSYDSRLVGVTFPEQTHDAEAIRRLPANKRQEAMRRLGMIEGFERYAGARVREGGSRTEAIEEFAAAHGVGSRSIKRWIRRYRDQGLIGLVDTRGGAAAAEPITEAAFEYFKSLWLDARQPDIKTCWNITRYHGRQHGLGWRVPSYPTMVRLVEQRIPLAVQVLHRQGQGAYEARCAPYIVKDFETVEPGAIWIGDHHQCNCWVRHRGRWVRPWITIWEDMRSRTIVGRHISDAPNQTTILQAMRRGIERWGVPDAVKIDNGKDYDSEMWTGTTKARRKALGKGYLDETGVCGLYAMMGVGISFSIPYHPQSKAIERWFDTLDRQVCKFVPTYCGKDSGRRPEALSEYLASEAALEAAMDLESFAVLVDKYIATYNRTGHGGAAMEGRSPAEVMQQRSSRRTVDAQILDLLMRVWSGELTVGKNGVRFRNLYFGQYDADLMMHQGRTVRVAYNPDDLRTVDIYDSRTWQFITTAEQAQLVAYGQVGEQDLREGMRQKARMKKIVKQAAPAARVAAMDLPDLAVEAMAARTRDLPEEPDGKNVRPVRTPMDGQADRIRQVRNAKQLRKAAGAEGQTHYVDLQLDQIEHKEVEYIDLKLFE